MTEHAAARLRIAAAWTGPMFALVLFTGWGLVAGMILPPWSPQDGPSEVAAAYQGDIGRIRVGMLLLMVAALLAIMFTAALCHQLRALRERSAPPASRRSGTRLGKRRTPALYFASGYGAS